MERYTRFYSKTIISVLALLGASAALAGQTCEDSGFVSGSNPKGAERVIFNESNKYETYVDVVTSLGAEVDVYTSEDYFIGTQSFSHIRGLKAYAQKYITFNNPTSLGASWVYFDYNGFGSCRNITVQQKKPTVTSFVSENVEFTGDLLSGRVRAVGDHDSQYSLRAFQSPLYIFEKKCKGTSSWTKVASSTSNTYDFVSTCSLDIRVRVSDGYFASSASSIVVNKPGCSWETMNIGLSCNSGWCSENFGRTCYSRGGKTVWQHQEYQCAIPNSYSCTWY